MRLEQPLRTAAVNEHRAIANVNAVIFRDYCGRVTANIVTSKLGVRQAAATLSDLPAEPLADKALDDT